MVAHPALRCVSEMRHPGRVSADRCRAIADDAQYTSVQNGQWCSDRATYALDPFVEDTSVILVISFALVTKRGKRKRLMILKP